MHKEWRLTELAEKGHAAFPEAEGEFLASQWHWHLTLQGLNSCLEKTLLYFLHLKMTKTNFWESNKVFKYPIVIEQKFLTEQKYLDLGINFLNPYSGFRIK